MSSKLRWVVFGLLGANLLLLQAMAGQAQEIRRVRQDAAAHREVVAQLETEVRARSVELAVLNVLDSHGLDLSIERRREVARTVLRASNKYDLAPELILAVIFTESRFDVEARSAVGAIGLMQLMPATASQLASELRIEWRGKELLTDPEINILLGSFYLRKLMLRFEDLDTALAAYNFGPGRLNQLVADTGRTPRGYPRKVQQVTADLRERFF